MVQRSRHPTYFLLFAPVRPFFWRSFLQELLSSAWFMFVSVSLWLSASVRVFVHVCDFSGVRCKRRGEKELRAGVLSAYRKVRTG